MAGVVMTVKVNTLPQERLVTLPPCGVQTYRCYRPKANDQYRELHSCSFTPHTPTAAPPPPLNSKSSRFVHLSVGISRMPPKQSAAVWQQAMDALRLHERSRCTLRSACFSCSTNVKVGYHRASLSISHFWI